jgi:glucan phosphoethanolaminetransferase (alkaline phosphatase superfamily)
MRPRDRSSSSRRENAVRSNAAIALAIGSALAAYAFMNSLILGDLIDHFDERELYKSAIYVSWLLCGFVLLFAFVATASRLVLAVAVPIFFVSLVINYAYVVISRRPLSVDVMEWLPNELGQLTSAWGEFGNEIAWALGKGAIVLGVLLAARVVIRRDRRFHRMLSTRSRLVVVGAFLSFNAAAVILQPPQMMAETNILVYGVPALFSTTPDLRPVPVRPNRDALVEKVALVVDESVTYAIFEQVVAPTIKGAPMLDFGESASTANCSAASNALLRWGVEQSRIQKPGYEPRSNPTIWAYAKAAGYRTSLIDGQSTGALQNYLGPKEFALIDEFVPASKGIDSDRHIAAKLNEILRRPGRQFVYVVKRGVHFPYEMNYPAAELPRDAPRAEKYARAVRYSNDGFFSRLTAGVDFSRALVIYTSDHGQDLSERSSHCNPDPRDVEYSVPIVVMTTAPGMRDLLSNALTMRNRASHLNIFPTTLYAFGYSQDWVLAEYGPNLAGPPTPYLVYVSLGWAGPGAARNRHTVDTSAFVRSTEFPRRVGATQ